MARTMEERFWSKVDKGASCWLWTGTKDRKGYGKFWLGDRKESAHRTSWRLSGRDLDPALTLDHICRNASCVNPDHLDMVTMRENLRRGLNSAAIFARRDSCIRGHEYTDENTAWSTYDNRPPWRRCRACHREDYYRRKARLALAPQERRD